MRWTATRRKLTNFYPRSPRGERPLHYLQDKWRCTISIHAPREGSDHSSTASQLLEYNFYPRSPRGERRDLPKSPKPRSAFLSTLPARGATSCFLQYMAARYISIHAPRKGSDKAAPAPRSKLTNFYPRSPQGERPLPSRRWCPLRCHFYPRSP